MHRVNIPRKTRRQTPDESELAQENAEDEQTTATR
jgi:hypothetical protein